MGKLKTNLGALGDRLKGFERRERFFPLKEWLFG